MKKKIYFVGFFLVLLLLTCAFLIKYLHAQQFEKPDKVIISRAKDTLPPLQETITEKEKVMLLYQDIMVLPPFPSGTMHCPMALIVSYTLDFYQADRLILHAVFEPTGCASVKLNDKIAKFGMTKTGEIFANDLQHILGLPALR